MIDVRADVQVLSTSATKGKFMRFLKKRPFALILLLLLIACGGNEEEPAATATPDEVSEVVPTETAVSPTAAPTAEITAVPTDTPIPEPTTAPEPDYVPIFEPASCQFDGVDNFEVECGYLVVPENREIPDGNQVRLHVAIFASKIVNPAPDPVVYLEGGPGGDALETADLIFADSFAPFLTDRDFIMFDQRGTSYSEPSLRCPEVEEVALVAIQRDLTYEEELQITLSAFDQCRMRLQAEGVDITQYNSANSAADLNDLRIALGYDEWNLYGISYGTKLALTTMRDYPEGIRSVILDSAYPQQVSLNTELPANTDRAFNTLFAGCANDAACNAAYPDLETRLFETAALLNENPITVDAFNAFTGEQYRAVVDGDGLINAVFQGLYSEEIIPLLPQMIVNTENGDYDLLALFSSLTITNLELLSRGVYYAVQCNEEVVFETEEEIRTAVSQYPDLVSYFGDVSGLFDVCNTWPSGAAAAVENEPVVSDIPTFIVAGEYDPITPPAWGELAASTLSNSYFFEFPGVGHGASVSDDCPASMTRAFLNEPTSEPNSNCIATMTPPDFAVAFDVDNPVVELVEFEGEDNLFGLRPESWEAVVPNMYARGASATDLTFIVQLWLPSEDADLLFDTVFAAFLGDTEFEEPVAELVDDQGRSWAIYEAEKDGYFVDYAATYTEEAAFGVMMFSTPEDNAAYYADLFIPALGAVRVEE